MEGQPRILVASPLSGAVLPALGAAFPEAMVRVAGDREAVGREVTQRVRFDVVVADLLWNTPEWEFRFDGLDVVDILGAAERRAPVIIATQGHALERDLLDEAALRPEVFSVYHKSAGPEQLADLVRDAAVGTRRDGGHGTVPRSKPLYEMFQGRRGETAARMAGAIAAGRATDGATLAAAAGVALNTASKVTTHYLGPIIVERGEHDPRLPMTLSAVYRWCGLHARYILSWCRRHGHGDVLVTR
ncbi:response regulator [Mycolicibacterium sp. 050158]|uniref:response regulator n=1 Tax=Mycolicibacterium sp. 050158 TaxID=3090602 RepID=UPI00299E2CB5|nr:response regulator [Mycolicibacterium sp. 050158]MDX1888146.1 response regulator [Mycolicibacterium sp. 050158]